MELFNQSRIYDFMGKTKYIISVSAILVIVSIAQILMHGFHFGADFTGGTVAQIRYEHSIPLEQIRQKLANSPFGTVEIQDFGSSNEIVLRFQKTSANVQQDIGDELRKTLVGTGKFEVRRVDIIGPKIGKELVEKGWMAFFVSLIGILIYVAIRFEWRYGIAAIIALLHDIIITAGAVSFFKVEFDLTVLTALLTLLGYSINDTIVIFDRIRETVSETKENVTYSLAAIINEAVSNTLSRTILTVATLFFVIITLFLFGGEIIHGFSTTMLLGVIIGAASSIFVASPFLIWFGFDVAKAKAKESQKKKELAEKEKMRAQYEQGVV